MIVQQSSPWGVPSLKLEAGDDPDEFVTRCRDEGATWLGGQPIEQWLVADVGTGPQIWLEDSLRARLRRATP